MPRKTIKDYEKVLKPLQVQVANPMVLNEYKPRKERQSVTAICEEHGISRACYYLWAKQPLFIAYKARLSERNLNYLKTKVDASLMRLIDDGTEHLTSAKAIEIYYKLGGHLVDRTVTGETEEDVVTQASAQEIDAELEKLNQLLNK
ncbi:phBC6A51 family helix-turn-helix protein [Alteribacter populi]|uniref:phBC6A51 family helix-turn-helix protein n=1 Tax=Alteribacter populi TaxID=2011011 RepID=UPI000BBA4B0E|nr:phBC6A51 family helix-turn-helix protein [Alteribacter populi]